MGNSRDSAAGIGEWAREAHKDLGTLQDKIDRCNEAITNKEWALLFSDEFIQAHSRFGSFGEFAKAAGFSPTAEISVTPAIDAFVKGETRFEGLEDMLEQAAKSFIGV